jgi:antitoxin (DNA-binding transcriptional repressor) of toxin-antitoxin stability system
LYNVKRYSASQFRQNLSRALDEVEQGQPVVVDRAGKRFRIVADSSSPRVRKVKPIFRVANRGLLDRGWTWTWTERGLSLQVGKRSRGK